MASVDREEIGRELGFLEAIGENVRVRQRDLDPRLQAICAGPSAQARLGARSSFGAAGRDRHARLALLVIEPLQLGDFSAGAFASASNLVHGVEIAQCLIVLSAGWRDARSRCALPKPSKREFETSGLSLRSKACSKTSLQLSRMVLSSP